MKSIGLLLLGLAGAAAATAGVATLPGVYRAPYVPPLIEKPDGTNDDGSFDGLVQLAAAAPPGSVVRVFWVHGMCTHPSSWAEDRASRLAAMIGGTRQSLGARPIGPHGASIRVERIDKGGVALELVFFSWSPLTASFKAALAFDRSRDQGGEFPYVRATLNGALKRGLVNDCLTDVIVYNGVNGNEIRRAMTEAMCFALGGRGDGRNCDITAGDSPPPVALVAESLGAKLVLDSLIEIGRIIDRRGDRVAMARLAQGLSEIKMVYLISNQVPLLDSAGSPREAPSWTAHATMGRSLEDLFRLMNQAHPLVQPGPAPVTVVAFSDPNDLLSYRIVPAHLGDAAEYLRVVNVILSNDPTYFGFVERPDAAHCGYAWNPYVFVLLGDGYRAGRPLPPVPSWTGACRGPAGLDAP
ncbi:MAG: hypothetical protein ACOY4R_23350 [Pseudomonadota bacterium]